MATGAPTSTPPQEGTVIDGTDDDDARGLLALEVALEAEVLVALQQHFLIDRAMDPMTRGAAFADGQVLEHMRPALGDVAFRAQVAFRH